jgi:hypothetical protein
MLGQLLGTQNVILDNQSQTYLYINFATVDVFEISHAGSLTHLRIG